MNAELEKWIDARKDQWPNFAMGPTVYREVVVAIVRALFAEIDKEKVAILAKRKQGESYNKYTAMAVSRLKRRFGMEEK